MTRLASLLCAALCGLAPAAALACEAHLAGTTWRIVSLQGDALDATEDRVPELVLTEDSPMRYAATVGCNRIVGGVEADGSALGFGMGAATRMACPGPLEAQEKMLIATLAEVRGYQMEDGDLLLLNAPGEVIARLTAR
ncbi:META domain-containing protein [Roseovarius aquimarinus]|uniref:META domain-containing protein n=1 Tax=Roseovarius aquimarinus TaxID=1229156 RepID=A0ABW7I4E8_9RHOB